MAFLRTGLTRLARNAVTAFYRPSNGWSPPPVLAVLRLTDACNLRCRMCFDRSADAVASTWSAGVAGPELDEPRWRALIDELAPCRCTFYLTGGEPLLASATVPIIEAVKARGGYVSLNTNGVLLKERAPALVAAGVDKIIVSLDGPPAIHDAIRSPTWNAIAEGLAAVTELKRQHGSATPRLRAQCVISPSNVGALVDTLKAAQELGLPEIRFQHLMFATSEDACRLDDFTKSIAVQARPSLLILPRGAIDLPALKAQLAELARRGKHGMTVRFEPPLRMEDIEAYYEHAERAFFNGCLSPWRRLVVSPRGEIGPCQGLYLGRYPEHSARDIWNGAAFRAFRRRLSEQGLFPFCARCCHREYYGPRANLDVS